MFPVTVVPAMILESVGDDRVRFRVSPVADSLIEQSKMQVSARQRQPGCGAFDTLRAYSGELRAVPQY